MLVEGLEQKTAGTIPTAESNQRMHSCSLIDTQVHLDESTTKGII